MREFGIVKDLSVLITYHNERCFLTECLSSLSAGGLTAEEILIYDDASRFPARDYVPAAMKCRIMRGDSQLGPSKARNILLRAAKCKFVHFHDADDLFDPEWLYQIRKQIEGDAASIIFTNVATLTSGRLRSSRLLVFPDVKRQKELVITAIRGSLLTCSGTFLRELGVKAGGYREELWQSEDYDFCIRLAATGAPWSVVDEPLVITRQRSDSRSKNLVEVYSCGVDAVGYLAAELPPEYRDELAEAAARSAGVLFRLGALEEARRAFRLAKSIGEPNYRGRNRLFSVLAKALGPMIAERLSLVYRTMRQL